MSPLLFSWVISGAVFAVFFVASRTGRSADYAVELAMWTLVIGYIAYSGLMLAIWRNNPTWLLIVLPGVALILKSVRRTNEKRDITDRFLAELADDDFIAKLAQPPPIDE